MRTIDISCIPKLLYSLRQGKQEIQCTKGGTRSLPQEIIDIILEYYGYHILRNGIYMTQIRKHDAKYCSLRKIPKLTHIYRDWGHEVNFIKQHQASHYKYTIKTVVFENTVVWTCVRYKLEPFHSNLLRRGRLNWGDEADKSTTFVVYQ